MQSKGVYWLSCVLQSVGVITGAVATGCGSGGSDDPFVLFTASSTVDVELYRAPLDEQTEPLKLSQAQEVGRVVTGFQASPNRTLVAYTGQLAEGNATALYVVPAQGGDSVLVSGPLTVRDFAWSPDNTHIAFSAAADADARLALYVVRPDGSNRVEVYSDPAGPDIKSFRWHPDSKRIAYEDDEEELYVVTSPWSEATKLESAYSPFAWSPDGESLAYTSVTYEIARSAPDGTNEVKLSSPLDADGLVWWLEWSPDGAHIGYAALDGLPGLSELYSSAADGSGEVTLNGPLAGGLGISSGTWSPDGTRIAYITDQETSDVYELFSTRADGTDNRKVNGTLPAGSAGFSGYALAWSPDSARIAYVAAEESAETQDLFEAAIDGSARRKVSSPLVGTAVPSTTLLWSLDGSRILYLVELGQPNVGPRELVSSAADGSDHVLISHALTEVGWSVLSFSVE